jgi:hypothetical protein
MKLNGVWGKFSPKVLDIFDTIVLVPKEELHIPTDPTTSINYEIHEETENRLNMSGNITNSSENGDFSMNLNITEVNEEIEPILSVNKNLDEWQFLWKFNLKDNFTNLVDIELNIKDKTNNIIKTWEEVKDAKKAEKEHESFLNWLFNNNLISQETYEAYKKWNDFRDKIVLLRWLIGIVPKVGIIEKLFPKGTPFGSIAANAILWAEIKSNILDKWLNGEIPQEKTDSLDKLYMFFKIGESYDTSSYRSAVTAAKDPNIKYGLAGNVKPGQKLDYKVEFENEGEGIAFGVYITDQLDTALNDSTLEIGPVISTADGSIIAPKGHYNPATRTITWFVGEIGPHKGGYTEISANVRNNAPEGTEIINFATVHFPSVLEVTRTNGIVNVVSVNDPPTADAGTDLTITSEEMVDTVIQGTASDVDPDNTLQYQWKKGETVLIEWSQVGENGECLLALSNVSLIIGSHTLTLEVSDGHDTVSDDMILTVLNSPPHAAPMGSCVYEINSDVTLEGSVSDYDGDLLNYYWKEDSNVLHSGSIETENGGTPVQLPEHIVSHFGLGTHTIELQVEDGINNSVSAQITVEIVDETVPTLAPVANKTILWPPNHKMVDITIEANAADNSGLPVTLSCAVTSNEPQNGLGDGDKEPDWTEPLIDQENGRIHLQLRSERSGSGDGRIYTITITATDQASNSSTVNIEIIVPHDN